MVTGIAHVLLGMTRSQHRNHMNIHCTQLHKAQLHEAQTIIHHILVTPSTHISPHFPLLSPVFPIFPPFSLSASLSTPPHPTPNVHQKYDFCASLAQLSPFFHKTPTTLSISPPFSPIFPEYARLANSVPAKFRQQEMSGPATQPCAVAFSPSGSAATYSLSNSNIPQLRRCSNPWPPATHGASQRAPTYSSLSACSASFARASLL